VAATYAFFFGAVNNLPTGFSIDPTRVTSAQILRDEILKFLGLPLADTSYDFLLDSVLDAWCAAMSRETERFAVEAYSLEDIEDTFNAVVHPESPEETPAPLQFTLVDAWNSLLYRVYRDNIIASLEKQGNRDSTITKFTNHGFFAHKLLRTIRETDDDYSETIILDGTGPALHHLVWVLVLPSSKTWDKKYELEYFRANLPVANYFRALAPVLCPKSQAGLEHLVIKPKPPPHEIEVRRTEEGAGSSSESTAKQQVDAMDALHKSFAATGASPAKTVASRTSKKKTRQLADDSSFSDNSTPFGSGSPPKKKGRQQPSVTDHPAAAVAAPASRGAHNDGAQLPANNNSGRSERAPEPKILQGFMVQGGGDGWKIPRFIAPLPLQYVVQDRAAAYMPNPKPPTMEDKFFINAQKLLDYDVLYPTDVLFLAHLTAAVIPREVRSDDEAICISPNLITSETFALLPGQLNPEFVQRVIKEPRNAAITQFLRRTLKQLQSNQYLRVRSNFHLDCLSNTIILEAMKQAGWASGVDCITEDDLTLAMTPFHLLASVASSGKSSKENLASLKLPASGLNASKAAFFLGNLMALLHLTSHGQMTYPSLVQHSAFSERGPTAGIIVTAYQCLTDANISRLWDEIYDTGGGAELTAKMLLSLMNWFNTIQKWADTQPVSSHISSLRFQQDPTRTDLSLLTSLLDAGTGQTTLKVMGNTWCKQFSADFSSFALEEHKRISISKQQDFVRQLPPPFQPAPAAPPSSATKPAKDKEAPLKKDIKQDSSKKDKLPGKAQPIRTEQFRVQSLALAQQGEYKKLQEPLIRFAPAYRGEKDIHAINKAIVTAAKGFNKRTPPIKPFQFRQGNICILFLSECGCPNIFNSFREKAIVPCGNQHRQHPTDATKEELQPLYSLLKNDKELQKTLQCTEAFDTMMR